MLETVNIEFLDSTNPCFTILPKKDFKKGPSLVFLLHYYGVPLGEARYKVERLLYGQDINVELSDLDTPRDFIKNIRKLGLSYNFTNEKTFFIAR